jgi:hypothetical protein
VSTAFRVGLVIAAVAVVLALLAAGEYLYRVVNAIKSH